MSYPPVLFSGDHGEASATVRGRDVEPDLRIGTRTEVTYLATGAGTSGAFGLYRWVMTGEPTGPAPHFHRTMHESFYVLEGSVGLYDGRGWRDGAPGDFLHVPPGGVHAFRNSSGVRAVMLLLFTPGAPREAYFEELADVVRTGRELDEAQWTELYARHDQYMV